MPTSDDMTAPDQPYDRPASASLPTPTDFAFPHPPYAIQQQLMRSLFECIEHRRIGIFESPTGTGKSLTLMCGALRWLRDHEREFRAGLEAQVAAVQREIAEAERAETNTGSGSGFDWLAKQSGTIVLKRRLVSLRAQLETVRKDDAGYQARRDRVRTMKEKHQQQAKRSILRRKNSSDLLSKPPKDDEEDEFALPADDSGDSDDDKDAAEAATDFESTARPHSPQILFCSRTHSQLAQIVHEVRKTVYAADVRLAVLASRQSTCINATVRQLGGGALLNERCLEMQKAATAKGSSRPTARSADGEQVLKKRRTVDAKSTAACSCEHYAKARIAELADEILCEARDIEELVAAAAGASKPAAAAAAACPYYAARAAAADAQLILLPYQMLLHRRTRRQMGIRLRHSVVIVDEGHNLLDTIAQMHAAEVHGSQLQRAHRQLLAYKAKYFARFSTANLLRLNQLAFVCHRLVKLLETDTTTTTTTAPDASRMLHPHELLSEAAIDTQPLGEILDFCERTRLAQKVHGFAQRFGTAVVEVQPAKKPAGRADYLKRLAEKLQLKTETPPPAAAVEPAAPVDTEPESASASALRPLLAFLDCIQQSTASADGRILLQHAALPSRRSLRYLLLNAAAHFDEVLAECRAVIVAGGTMQPTAELRQQLFAAAPAARVCEHFYDHVVPAEAILPMVVAAGPAGEPLLFNYATRGTPAVLAELLRTMRNVCAVVPAGVVAFFPSYDYLEAFARTLPATADGQQLAAVAGKRVFREPRGAGSAALCDRMLVEYGRAARSGAGAGRGALLLSVVGGKLSEGLNFADDLGRCVLVVGMPYANRGGAELAERMAHVERQLGDGAGAEYYENLCMKAVNQCIGRAIRHIGDYAAVLLVDQRYATRRDRLPAWIGRSLVVGEPFARCQARLARFFRQRREPPLAS